MERTSIAYANAARNVCIFLFIGILKTLTKKLLMLKTTWAKNTYVDLPPKYYCLVVYTHLQLHSSIPNSYYLLLHLSCNFISSVFLSFFFCTLSFPFTILFCIQETRKFFPIQKKITHFDDVWTISHEYRVVKFLLSLRMYIVMTKHFVLNKVFEIFHVIEYYNLLYF